MPSNLMNLELTHKRLIIWLLFIHSLQFSHGARDCDRN